MQLNGRRVTVMGLGHFGGGVAAARWLAGQGAAVTVTDVADAAALADAIGELNSSAIKDFHLGGHRHDDFRQADLVVVNPAVRPDSPYLALARQHHVPIATEIDLFMSVCPATIVGVTGSNGKSTTATMTAAILRAAGRRVWLGGNLGGSLLDRLGDIRRDDWVVLELSSFQLWHLRGDCPDFRANENGTVPFAAGSGPNLPGDILPPVHMPEFVVVTNCTPNHLDWHGSFAHYRTAKQRLIAAQQTDNVAVLNTHDAEVSTWRPLARGKLVPPASLDTLPALRVPGEHNRINAACAAAVAAAAGCDAAAIAAGLADFRGLPQRLEWLAVVDGRRVYNDSTATTPESTIAALRSIDGPVWLLAGGRSKGFDFGPLAAAIVQHARGAALFGGVREPLRDSLTACDASFPCIAVERFEAALDWCLDRARPGEAIVFSPACASTDQFRNFRDRGEQFAAAVAARAGRARS